MSSPEPTFDAFTGKPLKSDPGAEAQFNSHTGPDPVPSSDAAKAVTAGLDAPAEPWKGVPVAGSDVPPVAGSDVPPVVVSDAPPFGSPVPPFGGPVPENNPPVTVDSPSIASDVETLIRETHTMVTEVHAFVAQLLEQVPTLVAAVESSPLGGMLGGLFGKSK